MPADDFLRSKAWRDWRLKRLAMNPVCEVPYCDEKATIVDHVVSRAAGGQAFSVSNTRCLCQRHDNQVKERPDGSRRSGGKLRPVGCSEDGWPHSRK